ncbi:MAG: hypothetical protein LBH15_04535 [Treponema sp.]|jgi:hypothetical protein|nr:hypothetical protein [Treponema sp.]
MKKTPLHSFCFWVMFFLFAAPFCFSQDFGLIVNQKALLADEDTSSAAIEYTGTAIPWLAAPLGGKADLYVSGGLSAHYDDEAWKSLPELYRSEISVNPGPGFRLEIGRIPFRESLSFVCAGLFDGLSAGFTVGGGRLRTGLFYTGLLYKKAAYIYMSPADQADYSNKDSYFASRRFIAALTWEKTSVFNTLGGLSFSGLCQFDLNDTETRIHSQYLEAQYTAPLGARFNTVSGAVIEAAEESGKDPYAAFALSAEIQWLLPTALSDVLTIGVRFSSGAWNDGLGVFIPVTAEAQGKILRPMFSGIALAEAAYSARLHRTLQAMVSGAYYLRTDKSTYRSPGMDASSASPLLGAEFYGALNFSPFHDLLFSLGGGVFLPQTGKVFSADTGIKYRLELTAGISL